MLLLITLGQSWSSSLPLTQVYQTPGSTSSVSLYLGGVTAKADVWEAAIVPWITDKQKNYKAGYSYHKTPSAAILHQSTSDRNYQAAKAYHKVNEILHLLKEQGQSGSQEEGNIPKM